MGFLYDFLISTSYIVLKIIALFNKKIRLFIAGRKETLQKLAVLKKEDNIIWFHAASLGEFEQGRPVIEKVKNQFPDYKIVLTFFSPSGYEVRKDYPLADVICYLPFDTKKKVKKFVEKLNPTLAIFIKYEFWPNLLRELQQKNIPTILISGIFRKNQLFFQFYGAWMRKLLQAFHHFFVQDENSKKLLNGINIKNVTVSGDTRFDRVFEVLQQANSIDCIAEFKNNQYTFVAGSTWREDEEILVDYINRHSREDEKFIIVPHNIDQKSIQKLKKSIQKKTILFSKKDGENLKKNQVFIIDCIGILTQIYAYADVAYVGGGLSKGGLHNILEPATFGIPIIIGGKNYQKFKEATDLINLAGCKVIKNINDFFTIFSRLKKEIDLRNKIGLINKNYIQTHKGATQITLDFIINFLN